MQDLFFHQTLILLLLFTAAAAFLLTGLATRYARRSGVIDVPGARSSHLHPVPRGGGAGIVASVAISSLALLYIHEDLWWHWAVLPGFLGLGVIGWVDDHRSLSARVRFAVQLAVSFVLLAFTWRQGVVESVPQLLVAGLAILWIANLYNFMDGSDGMAGVQGVFCGLVLAWLFHRAGDDGSALLALLIASSCAGFLPWNLVRARVFMGDVASVPLGFALGALLIYGVMTGALPPGVAILVLSVFLVDASLTLAGRIIRRERWYTAHRQHLYQQLISAGWTHQAVLVLYQSINIALVLPAVIVAEAKPELSWLLASGLIATLTGGWYIATRRLGVTA